jgi:hypothetical protein
MVNVERDFRGLYVHDISGNRDSKTMQIKYAHVTHSVRRITGYSRESELVSLFCRDFR